MSFYFPHYAYLPKGIPVRTIYGYIVLAIKQQNKNKTVISVMHFTNNHIKLLYPYFANY